MKHVIALALLALALLSLAAAGGVLVWLLASAGGLLAWLLAGCLALGAAACVPLLLCWLGVRGVAAAKRAARAEEMQWRAEQENKLLLRQMELCLRHQGDVTLEQLRAAALATREVQP